MWSSATGNSEVGQAVMDVAKQAFQDLDDDDSGELEHERPIELDVCPTHDLLGALAHTHAHANALALAHALFSQVLWSARRLLRC